MKDLTIATSVVTVIIGLILFVDFTKEEGRSPNSWHRDIKWVSTIPIAKKLAKKKNKPIMLLVVNDWSDASEELFPKFSTSKEIAERAKDFVMVNTEGQDEPKGKKYDLDGKYVPRILFMDPRGRVRPEFYHQMGSPNFKYFFPDVEDILSIMSNVTAKYGKKIGPKRKKIKMRDFTTEATEAADASQ